ncbi:hypothetical protein Vadar_005824 [Vaccinium darrowii]|uniref:Uncharacterized protein n=1 Tax=Vaccinium darrowii TaxID=229202 RepID=A0ACB7Z2K7_9ERIC|nr:hypothetical protein Vadar_005824 [Vaccinium darrowii]
MSHMASTSIGSQTESCSGANKKGFSWLEENPGCLGDVKDQKDTPLCAMYAAADACSIQAAIKFDLQNPPKVSITHLAEKVPSHLPLFCEKPEGGNYRASSCWAVLDYIKENGVPIENEDALMVQKLKIKKYIHVTTELGKMKGYEKQIIQYIKRHPICGEFMVNNEFDNHKEGVYEIGIGKDRIGEGKPQSHAMVIVGYEFRAEDGLLYFIVKNSWHPLWGINGYGKISSRLLSAFSIPCEVSIEEEEKAADNSANEKPEKAPEGKKKQNRRGGSKKKKEKNQPFQDLARETFSEEDNWVNRMEYLLLSNEIIAELVPKEKRKERYDDVFSRN